MTMSLLRIQQIDDGEIAFLLQRIYDSEINLTLSTLWDAGFRWRLGDELNGFKAEGQERTLLDAVKRLASAAREHYPDSTFAKTWA